MNWRALFLSGLFAASIGLTGVTTASADPPPWAGRWHKQGKHDKHWRKHHRDHRHDGWGYDNRWRNDRYWSGRYDDDWRWRYDRDWWRRDRDRSRDRDWWYGDRDRWRSDRYWQYGGYRW